MVRDGCFYGASFRQDGVVSRPRPCASQGCKLYVVRHLIGMPTHDECPVLSEHLISKMYYEMLVLDKEEGAFDNAVKVGFFRARVDQFIMFVKGQVVVAHTWLRWFMV